jgi:hypothetical protein
MWKIYTLMTPYFMPFSSTMSHFLWNKQISFWVSCKVGFILTCMDQNEFHLEIFNTDAPVLNSRHVISEIKRADGQTWSPHNALLYYFPYNKSFNEELEGGTKLWNNCYHSLQSLWVAVSLIATWVFPWLLVFGCMWVCVCLGLYAILVFPRF